MTPQARRPVFELLRLTASPIGDALSIVDVEGRFGGATGRFARRPTLVVEPADGERLELLPVHLESGGDGWRAAYAVPVSALAGARLALAIRGALYELPEPHFATRSAVAAEGGARLAREANALRRKVERLEEDARDAERRAQDAEGRAAEAEARAVGAQTRAAELEEAVEDLRGRVEVAEAQAAEAAERERQAAEAAEAAEERARAADDRLRAEAAGVDVLRDELAEERERAHRAVRDLQARLDAARAEQAAEPEAEADADADVEETRPLPVAEPEGDDEDEDDTHQHTPPGGIVRRERPSTGGSFERAAPPVVHHHRAPGPERWLAVVALWLAVAIVVVLVLSLRG